jgi:hypothetical protein
LETPYRWYNLATRQWWYDGAEVRHPITWEATAVRDDGTGFVSPPGFPRPGQHTMFVAAYRLFLVGMLLGHVYLDPAGEDIIPGSSGKKHEAAIPDLAAAYVLTGNARYARQAGLLLWLLAERYPGHAGTREDGTHSEGMHWGEVSTTESFWLHDFFTAYDMVFDALTPELEAELATVIHRVRPQGEREAVHAESDPSAPGLHGTVRLMAIAAIESAEAGRRTDADWALRWIDTELVIARCFDAFQLLDHVLRAGRYSLRHKMANNFYRDGRYHYDSTSYMAVTCRQFLEMPAPLHGASDPRFFPEPLDLYADPAFGVDRTIALAAMTDTGSVLPTFGDADESLQPPAYFEAQRNGHPWYDRRMEVAAGCSPAFLSLFRRLMRGVPLTVLASWRARLGDFRTLVHALPLDAIVQEQLPPALSPSLLEDSAIAYFRTGRTFATRHDLVFWGQPSAPHKHGDKLGIWLGGRGGHLAASGGFYPFTWVSPKAAGWETQSAACWVVVINGQNQQDSASEIVAYHEGHGFQLATMRNTSAYPGCDYQRTVCLVPGPLDGDAYVIDVFRASNGFLFDYNTRGHAASTFGGIRFDAGSGPLEWNALPGTLAGEDVPLYGYPGYGWMRNARETWISGDFTFTYDYGKAKLKVHGLSHGQRRQLVYAEGERGGHEMHKSPWDPQVLWRVEDPVSRDARVQFTVVLESVGKLASIDTIHSWKPEGIDITREGYHPVGMEVVHADKTIDHIIINDPGNPATFTDERGASWKTDAAAVFIRRDPGNASCLVEIVGGTSTMTPLGEFRTPPSITGTVRGVEHAARRITVELDKPVIVPEAGIAGRIAFVSIESTSKVRAFRLLDPKVAGSTLRFTSRCSLVDATVGSRSPKLAREPEPCGESVDGEQVHVAISRGDRFNLNGVVSTVTSRPGGGVLTSTDKQGRI